MPPAAGVFSALQHIPHNLLHDSAYLAEQPDSRHGNRTLRGIHQLRDFRVFFLLPDVPQKNPLLLGQQSIYYVSSMKFSGKTFSRNGGTPFLRFPEPFSKSFKLGKTTKHVQIFC